MEVKQYVVISATFIKGKHAPVGTIISVDEGTSDGQEVLTMLQGAGRIRLATEEDLKPSAKVDEEVKDEVKKPKGK